MTLTCFHKLEFLRAINFTMKGTLSNKNGFQPVSRRQDKNVSIGDSHLENEHQCANG